MTSIKCYSELITLPTYLERFKYLELKGTPMVETFGHDRWINQKFYTSSLWLSIRNSIIIRDNGCEMGLIDYPISGLLLLHHINPITVNDIINLTDKLTNPENIICVSHTLHNAIHYGGNEQQISRDPIQRKPNDTIPWKR